MQKESGYGPTGGTSGHATSQAGSLIQGKDPGRTACGPLRVLVLGIGRVPGMTIFVNMKGSLVRHIVSATASNSAGASMGKRSQSARVIIIDVGAWG